MNSATAPTPASWSALIASAYEIFDALEAGGFGAPTFSLGGGTVLMLRFKHRVSKDIDLFGYDAQWLSLLSPRLNDTAAAMATGYSEQANTVKIVMPHGDIDFIIAGDVAIPVKRGKETLAGREMLVDPVSEILAKKLFYRAASLKARDVYDLCAAIDLDPESAKAAVRAAASEKQVLLRRLNYLDGIDRGKLLEGILPYEGRLRHADGMVAKATDLILTELGGPRHEA